MTIADGFSLESLRAEDLEDFVRNGEWAFAFGAPEDNRDLVSKTISMSRARVVKVTDATLGDVGELAAANSSFAFSLRVPGAASIPASGLTWVGVQPTYRRKGLLSSMIRDHFALSLERGEVVSVLYASETAIYQRFGYGLSHPVQHINLSPGVDLHPVPGSDQLRVRFESIDADKHRPIIDRVLGNSTMPGGITALEEHTAFELLSDVPSMREGLEPKRILTVFEDATPVAYAIFARKMDWDIDGGATLKIQSWATTSAASAHRLLTALSTMDLLRKGGINNVPIGHPLVTLHRDIRVARASLGDGVWTRILNVEEALSKRTYSIDTDFSFSLQDDYLPQNSGLWKLSILGGVARISRSSSTESSADFPLTMSQLSAIYQGGTTLSSLANAGLVSGDNAAIQRASLAFQHHEAPGMEIGF